MNVNALVAVSVALWAERLAFQTYHWNSKGAPYYGDHLLFQRLYEARDAEIDRMGEVLLAVGGPELVAAPRTLAGMMHSIEAVENSGQNDFQKAVMLVNSTLERINAANAALGNSPYTVAVNNVLAGVADKHLEALYLLRQRLG